MIVISPSASLSKPLDAHAARVNPNTTTSSNAKNLLLTFFSPLFLNLVHFKAIITLLGKRLQEINSFFIKNRTKTWKTIEICEFGRI